MSAWEQQTAAKIATALHRLEAVAGKTKGTPRRVHVAIAALHKTLHDAACEHAGDLGIDVAPLSGGLPKPPEDP